MKLTVDQLKAFIEDLSDVGRDHSGVIESDVRISKPFHEAEKAAAVKYDQLSEKPPTLGSAE